MEKLEGPSWVLLLTLTADTTSKCACPNTLCLQMYRQRHVFRSEVWFYNVNNSDAQSCSLHQMSGSGFFFMWTS